ncbi:hypothetical protein PHET_05405 [Paragonimus heterotremus]|uniref:Late endosomal/lysosomal adaptor and MAPK and MTOR activator 5 n=1 Tax=Paragonimus heterotremus TaxID=100268 RepID=A0A8J4SPC4_9TREM|nr:hypothetical protein PHET_05405 [Paragonimus heterotremus]
MVVDSVRLLVGVIMEKPLSDHLMSVHSQPDVTAVQCIDRDGLCLASCGPTNELVCGLLSSVYKHAQWIGNDNDSPVVVIEQDSGSIVLCDADGVLTAIHKSRKTE